MSPTCVTANRVALTITSPILYSKIKTAVNIHAHYNYTIKEANILNNSTNSSRDSIAARRRIKYFFLLFLAASIFGTSFSTININPGTRPRPRFPFVITACGISSLRSWGAEVGLGWLYPLQRRKAGIEALKRSPYLNIHAFPWGQTARLI